MSLLFRIAFVKNKHNHMVGVCITVHICIYAYRLLLSHGLCYLSFLYGKYCCKLYDKSNLIQRHMVLVE